MTPLLEHLWQSTWFAGVAWLAALALRGESAVLRHWVWLIASVKFLVPFSWLVLAGSQIDLGLEQPIGVIIGSASVFGFGASGAETVPAIQNPGLMAGLIALWMLGSLILLARWSLAWLRAANIRRNACIAPLNAPVPLALTTDLREPAVSGLFRPLIMLPKGLVEELTPAQLRAVLAHELAHVSRRDNLKSALHTLVEIIFWFHPIVWWIGRRLLEERERACDEAVIEQGHEGREYATGILSVCQLARYSEHAWMMRAAGGDLRLRIQTILRGGACRQLTRSKQAAFAMFSGLLLAMPILAGALSRSERPGIDASVRSADHSFTTLRQTRTDAAASSITRGESGLHIRNTSLRELIAFAYGSNVRDVRGSLRHLDAPRFDVDLPLLRGLSDEPEMAAYRSAVTALLAREFNFQILINRRCQQPCGRAEERASRELLPGIDEPTQTVTF
jgi:bla regulator protein BlaR1